MRSRLHLYLLGPPRVECDGLPVDIDRRKALALLVYLAVTGQARRRDSLVNLLWPDYDTRRGRAALRRTLFALRQALPEGCLDADRDEIALQPSVDLWVDVDQFRQHLAECEAHGHPVAQPCPACVMPLTEAVALVQGDFLSGFGLKDAFNFDDWQLFQAEDLRQALAGALERLVHWHASQREFDLALGYARRQLALDPLDEAVHRQLMCLHAWSGRRSAALQQYDECLTLLEDQLGVPPQQATTDLYRVIHDGSAPPPPAGPAPPAGPVLGELPAFLQAERAIERPIFVAREAQLAKLDAHLDAAVSGKGRIVFVTGDAGSGKTALVEAFARRSQAQHADLLVASGNCSAYTGIGDPYLPFRQILELLAGDIEPRWAAGAMTRDHALRLWKTAPLVAQALADVGQDLVYTFVHRVSLLKQAALRAPGQPDWSTRLSELAEHRPTASGVAGPQQAALFEQYGSVLRSLTGRYPLLLVLDDFQWADAGSIHLLFHLGRQLGGRQILIVVAYRPEEVAIGRDGGRHPLEPVVHELQRDYGDIAIRLGQSEGQEFVEALLDSEPNRLGSAFRDMLFRQTHGHPLFTIELLRGLQERGDLVKDRTGKWVEGTELDWETLPARVEAVIAERISRLAQPLQAAMRVASVEGETFTAEVLARIRGVEDPEMLYDLSGELDSKHRLIRAQSIQRVGEQLVSSYRFRHILTQRYLYGSLDEVQRVHLHEQVGTTLEALYGAQGHEAEVAVQLALHFEKARRAEKAVHYLHQAGDRAVQLSAYAEATALLARGLSLLASLPDSSERLRQELALQISLGIASKNVIPGTQGEDAFTRARQLCYQTGETSQLCRVLGELLIYPYVRAEHPLAREIGKEALSLAQQTGEALLAGLAHWHLGFVYFALGEFRTARRHLREMIAFYEPRQHHRGLITISGSDAGASALAYDACCLWCLGYPEQALVLGQEALALARDQGHAFSQADVVCFAGCLLHWMHRDFQAVKENAEELLRLSQVQGFFSFLTTGSTYKGLADAMLGRNPEGMELLRQGLATRESIGARCHSSGILASLAEAQAAAGEPQQALATVHRALALVAETDERYCEAEVHRIRAELLLSQDDEATAEESLHKAIEVARRQQAKSWELRATTSLARLWQAQGRVDQAREMLNNIYGWFTEGWGTPDLQEARALLDELR